MPSSVREVVEQVLGVELPHDGVDLIETGLMDSLALVTLVFELEQALTIEIPFASIDVDHFRSVRSMTRLVQAVSRA